MYIIVGLGNPGREYADTRHNIGFDVVGRLAEQENIPMLEKKHKAIIGKGIVAGQKCILAKPQTYMNLSGESVRELAAYYKIDEAAELIVVSDDISLEVGQLRIRKKGSAGGHNGLKNIIANLGHDTFMRVKMGVGGKPEGWDLIDHVLGRFPPKEREAMDEAVGKAADAIRMMIAEGADAAMNRYNSVKKAPKAADIAKAPKDTGNVPGDAANASGSIGKASGEAAGVSSADAVKVSRETAEVSGDAAEVTENAFTVPVYTENMGDR